MHGAEEAPARTVIAATGPPDAPEELRVLAVEDSDIQARIVAAVLGDEPPPGDRGTRFVVTRVATLAAALEHLERTTGTDVVLLDLALPDSTGMGTLDAVLAATDAPVVVLSASGEAAGYAAIERGAQDFVCKDRDLLAALPRTISFAVRRAQLTAELEDALEAREVADARLRTLLSMASHELRSPLASLRGLSGLLVDRWDELAVDQRRLFAERIHRRLGHATAVATLYLNAAADGEDIHAVQEPVDLSELCEDVATTVPHAPDRVAVEAATAHFDPNHLAAILGNLLSNAVKYGQRPVVLSGDDRRLVVSDEGDGIPEEALESLFRPWHRRSRDGVDSTGLGLALAAQLARANGATLGYQRRDGRTLFTLDLPHA